MDEQLHIIEWKSDIDIDMDLRCFNLSESHENVIRNQLRVIDRCFQDSLESKSKIGQILELRGLMFSFIASYRNPEIYGALSHAPSGAAYEAIYSALRRFRANLKRRQSLSNESVEKMLNTLPVHAREILRGVIAYKFRDTVSDMEQINFANPDHRQLLTEASKASLGWVNKGPGRPKSSFDQLLIQLTSFYEKNTGQNAVIRFRGDDAPDSNFEKMIFAAFEISSLIQQPELSQPERTYSGALKAYRRATKPKT